MQNPKAYLRFNDADRSMDAELAELDPNNRVATFDHLVIRPVNRYELRKYYLKYLKADAIVKHSTHVSERNIASVQRYTAMSQIVHLCDRMFSQFQKCYFLEKVFVDQEWKKCVPYKEN